MNKKVRQKSLVALEYLKKEIGLQDFYSWTSAVNLLVKHFGWQEKTSSNRIHELVEAGYLERRGNFERPTPREPKGVDKRKIRLAK
jgi:hypothetical protein